MMSLSEDRILDFLDGRLNGVDEEELLHRLAVSPERRQMLREHLKVRELTTNLSKQQSYTVPEVVTSELFTKLALLGYTAPSTMDILNNAPGLIRSAREEERAAAVAAMSYFRFLRSSAFVTACLVSFLLGVGAFYVFGSNLGLHSLSQQRELSERTAHGRQQLANHNVPTVMTIEMPPLNSAAMSAQPLAAAAFRPASGKNAELASAAISSVFPDRVDAAGIAPSAPGVVQSEVQPRAVPVDEVPSFTAPKIDRSVPLRSVSEPSYYLNSPLEAAWSPLLNERGTISLRFGAGRAPGNTTGQWTSLSEIKFSWTLKDYFLARASLGEMQSWWRVPVAVQVGASGGPMKWEIAPLVEPHPIAVAGAELGITLDPIDIPIEMCAGFLADGEGNIYPRASVMGQFELFDALTVAVGVEGMAYTHDYSNDMTTMVAKYHDYKATMAPGTSKQSEILGFVGPTLEMGWRF